MSTDTVFYNRRGEVLIPPAGAIVKPRRGIFAAAVANDAIALVWPNYTRGIPDLPGGGIDEGETPDQAMAREWVEETGLNFDVAGPFGQEFQHVRGFYAEDKNEYWIYDQTFRFYTYLGQVTPGEKWVNPEGDQTSWESLDSLTRLPVNRAHWCAIPILLSQAGLDVKL